MNKQIISMTAVAAMAGAALAVESKNVVGFQTNSGTGTFNFIGATFVPVGTDGSEMALSNITVNADFEFASDSITVFNNQGNKVFSAYYLDAATAAENDMEAGWYDADKADDGDYVLLNSYLLPIGSSFAFNKANSTAGVKFMGEVVQAAQPISGSGTFNLICNSSPVDLVLSNITVNAAFEFASDSITVFNNQGNKVFSAYYLDAATAAENDMEAGWYDADKADDGDYVLLNSYQIPAGMGFAFNKANAAAAVIIPNPISE